MARNIDSSKTNGLNQLNDHFDHHNQLALAANADDTRITAVETGVANNVTGITLVANSLTQFGTRLTAVEAAQAGTAAVEELQQSTLYAGSIGSPAVQIPALIAKLPCNIISASLAVSTGSQVASDTIFYTVALTRYRAGAPAVIATKTTKTTGGAAIATKVDWSFDAVTPWSTTNQLCQLGDLITFDFTATGAVTTLSNVIFTIRYEPV